MALHLFQHAIGGHAQIGFLQLGQQKIVLLGAVFHLGKANQFFFAHDAPSA